MITLIFSILRQYLLFIIIITALIVTYGDSLPWVAKLQQWILDGVDYIIKIFDLKSIIQKCKDAFETVKRTL